MIYVIMGPTCSGKTSLANAIMDKLHCPAINYDAFQIYQDMNIGTAKLSKEDPHYSSYYLLDIKTPDKSFSVMEYQLECRKTLEKLLKTNKDIVLVGGTGLYLRASIYDYQFEVEEDRDNSDLEKLTNEELLTMLQTLDLEASKKIHVNNRKRLIRAISMIRNSSLTKTERINAQKHELIYPRDQFRFIFLSPDRETLYNNINARVVEMMNEGLVDEVKHLLNKYNLSITARQGIGYKEVIDYLDGKYSLEECVELINRWINANKD